MKEGFQLLIVITIILLLCSCGKECLEGRVAIMYAFPAEGQLLRSEMTLDDSVFSLGRVFWIGKLEGKDVIVVNSDVGMTNAAMTAQLLIDRYKPKEIIFTGICGGIDPENNIGDIVIPKLWVTHDYGLYNQEGFSPWPIRVHQPGKERPDTMMFFPVDESLLRIAENVKPELKPLLGRTPKIKVGGKGASGNSFIDQVEKREWLAERLDAQIVDMESAVVVQVARINGVGELVVRLSSDYTRSALPAITLSSNDYVLTACANDFGFEQVFSRQIEALGKPEDLLLCISTSGNSPNLITAANKAKEKKMKTVGLLGRDGGKLKDLSDLSIIVPSNNTPRIQETHICICHILCELVEKELFG